MDVKKCLVHKYNKLNIHLNWEPMIQELVNECGFKFIHFDKNFLKKRQLRFYDERKQRDQDRKKGNTQSEKRTTKKMMTLQKNFSLKSKRKNETIKKVFLNNYLRLHPQHGILSFLI